MNINEFVRKCFVEGRNPHGAIGLFKAKSEEGVEQVCCLNSFPPYCPADIFDSWLAQKPQYGLIESWEVTQENLEIQFPKIINCEVDGRKFEIKISREDKYVESVNKTVRYQISSDGASSTVWVKEGDSEGKIEENFKHSLGFHLHYHMYSNLS